LSTDKLRTNLDLSDLKNQIQEKDECAFFSGFEKDW